MRLLFLLLICISFIQCKTDDTDQNLVSDSKASQQIEKSVVKHVDVASAKQMIETNPKLIIIDARTPEEYIEGTLPNAINIDVKADDFTQKIESLDKSATYLIHCRSGSRSMKASEIMLEKGFVDITNMDGGYLDWLDNVEE